ncbi:acetyltransferase [Aggregatilinea lenta]|uniref:acetyltransferase n=1 Tax=Aggregatilinea lenta TaxID=913108 RepID=UPI000E5C037E|nr:acetyltransferase [Aggregatilinea lenta]
MPEPLVIWGAGGHALVVADIFRQRGDFTIAGFIDDVTPERRGSAFAGSVVLGGREQLDGLHAQGIHTLFLAFGDCAERLKLADFVRAQGFSLATAVHPSAVIAPSVPVGAGTAIMAGVVVNPAVRIGENAILNTRASVDHECVIEDGAHLSPGVCLGGRVSVGRGTWIGIGAVVKDKVRIGSGSIIGAGAVVLDDIPDGVVAYGVPAKLIRRITE